MSLLTPWGLLALAGVPVLMWLWRFAAVRRRTLIPSLVPFEHLFTKPPSRRTRLVVNLLFWLQLAALVLAAAALARPSVVLPGARVTLAVLDTSASMGASGGGATVFERAKSRLASELRGASPSGQVFIVASAPPEALMPAPIWPWTGLAQTLDAARVAQMGSRLDTAIELGRAMLGAPEDELIIVTDEPEPDGVGPRARVVSLGSAAPNVAIVGLDARLPLCAEAKPSVMAVLANFSEEPADVRLSARQEGRTLAEDRVRIEPDARVSVSLEVPEETDGWVLLRADAERDALAADDIAWVRVRRQTARPVWVRSGDAEFVSRLGRWLDACPGLRWDASPPAGAHVLITDDSAPVAERTFGLIRFAGGDHADTRLSEWVVDTEHPIGAYLPAVAPVAAAVAAAALPEAGGRVVLSGVAGGERVPLIVAREARGRREAHLAFAPARGAVAQPVLFAFLNSLRWVMGEPEAVATGEPMTVPGFHAGTVGAHRPDGRTAYLPHAGGPLTYADTTVAGLYRFAQGGAEVTVAANFLDPVESDLRDRASTWTPVEPPEAGAAKPARQPIAEILVWIVLAILVVEWWVFSRRVSQRGEPS